MIFILLKFLLLSLLITGCASFNNPSKDPHPLSVLMQVANLKGNYCEFAREKIEAKRYAVSKCDGLLFSALHNLACGYPSLDSFDGDTTGQLFRSPGHDCFIPPSTDNGAISTISKDMYAGKLLKVAVSNDREKAQGMLEYCNDNRVLGGLGCQVGKAINVEAEISQTILPPTTIKLLEDMAVELGDRENSDNGRIAPLKGFKAHLQVVMQLVYGAVYKGISENGAKLLEYQADRQPANALYAGAYSLYLDGNMEEAAKNLLENCPMDQLPNSHDHHCAKYKFQRDGRSDLEPCKGEPKRIHDGTDCAFAAAVILGEIR
jgi:hypothetical protein